MLKVNKVRHIELQYFTREELAKLFKPADSRMQVWSADVQADGRWCIELGFIEERSDGV